MVSASIISTKPLVERSLSKWRALACGAMAGLVSVGFSASGLLFSCFFGSGFLAAGLTGSVLTGPGLAAVAGWVEVAGVAGGKRSGGRRGGKAGVSECRSRGSPDL